MTLTPQQERVLAADGDLLVLGGPGSGKTTVGLLKARTRIAKTLAPYQQILFLSFSNSAVYQILRASRLTLTSTERRQLVVHTFHSFCWQILRAHGGLLELRQRLTVIAPEDESAMRAGFTREQWEETRQQLLEREGRVALDLFAPLLARLLSQCATLRKLFASCHPLLIVDEFQDTDDVQWQIVNLLGEKGELVCLADPHQRIYDFRPGVSPARLDVLRSERRPNEIDLGSDNHRSPLCDILTYANHVIDPTLGSYRSAAVTVHRYQYLNQCGVRLKHAVKEIQNRVQAGQRAESVSIAILASTNNAVNQISAWLAQPTRMANFTIRHDGLVDHDQLMHAWRAVVAVMDGSLETVEQRGASILSQLANLHRCFDSATALQRAAQITTWAQQIRSGSWPRRSGELQRLRTALEDLTHDRWTGHPTEDVDRIINRLASGDGCLSDVVGLCRSRAPLRERDRVTETLARRHKELGSYSDATSIFQRALVQDRLADTFRPASGCVLMTMHKSKGKEFDGVVIYDGLREPNRLVLRGDPPPYERSRRLLRVAITRARHQVVIFTPQSAPCPMLP